MALFYACLKYNRGDWEPQLVTFVNREAADEWWRMISTPPSPHVGNVERLSPQFYVKKGEYQYNIAYPFTHPALPDVQQFYKKMTTTLFKNAIFHPIAITDHISGGWYFIRSKVDPWDYWYIRTNGECLVCGNANCDAVHVSNEYRTNFCVRVRNPGNDAQTAEDFVMIGRDGISIAGPNGLILRINDAGNLKATREYQGEADLLFGDLKKRFITRAEKQVNGEIWEYVESVERGSGEAWELVN